MADPVSIGLAVGGSALGSLADRSADKRRDKILKHMMLRQARQQADLDAAIMGEVGTLRGETPEAERAEAMSEFVGRLRDARATQPQQYGARGAVSSREVADRGDLAADLGQFAGREADITARLDSQSRMRENQALRGGQLDTNLREQLGEIQSGNFLDELRLARARPNALLGAAGSLLKGFGQSGAFSGLGAGKITPPSFKFKVDPRTLPIKGL